MITDAERKRIREYAQKVAADAPPLTKDQELQLAALLRPAVAAVRAATAAPSREEAA